MFNPPDAFGSALAFRLATRPALRSYNAKAGGRTLPAQEYRLRHNRFSSTSRKLAVAGLPFISSTCLAPLAALALPALSAGLRLAFASKRKNMQQHIFPFESELQNTSPLTPPRLTLPWSRNGLRPMVRKPSILWSIWACSSLQRQIDQPETLCLPLDGPH
jgi:hypothetical protein